MSDNENTVETPENTVETPVTPKKEVEGIPEGGHKVGVFICHCGLNIAGTVDVEGVAESAGKLDGVVHSETYKYMCSAQGAEKIKAAIKDKGVSSVVVSSCSPRMHEPTFQSVLKEAGLNPYVLEMSNIREHCSWIHMDDKEGATEKAKSLTGMAVAKARLNEPLTKSSLPVNHNAVVMGGGVAGLQAAMDMADSVGSMGGKVYLVEQSPSIGGRMAQLDKTYPTLDCSSCILTPKMMETAGHPSIELITYAEVDEVEGSIGNFTVHVTEKPRYVDVDKCTGCGECAPACRMADRFPNEFDMGLKKRSAIYMPFPQAVPMKYTIDADTCLMTTKGKCGKGPLCQEACLQGAIDFDMQPVKRELKAGAIIVATGYTQKAGNALKEYGYDRSRDVVTNLEFERILSASGPTNGTAVRLSDGKPIESITFVMCVGSRSKNHNEHCCRVGCMSALKHAAILKEKYKDGIQVNICYTDLRSYGRGYEELYKKVRAMGVQFISGRPSEVNVADDGKLSLDVFDSQTNKLLGLDTDMVVLVSGLDPREDGQDIARKVKVSLSSDEFLMEAHPKLKPMDTLTGGIFLAGAVQGPKDIPECVSHASGAAARALNILTKDTLESEGIIAMVNNDLCNGCAICEPICEYDAITIEPDPTNAENKLAIINEALCAGCGACVAACPSGALEQKGYKNNQLMAMIDAAVEVPK